MSGPFSGVRILDLTSVVLGPYAMQILGDLGADIIKIESPEGDIVRYIGESRTKAMGPTHLAVNRNKRSIVLDLKRPAARAALLRLAGNADALVHSMRPKAMAALGLAYEDLKAVNPGIVYCGAYGFRADGPYGDKPAYDDMIQGISGVASLMGTIAGEPRYAPTILADKTVGLTLTYAVMAALFHRQRTGEGQQVEVPMFETMVSYLMIEHLWQRTGDPDGKVGYARVLAPSRKPYRTADGYICLLPYTDRQWHDFFALAGQPAQMQDPRFSSIGARTRNIEALYRLVAGITPARGTKAWLAVLDQLSIPAAPVNALEDLFDDPHLQAGGMFQTREHPSEGPIMTVAPPVRFSSMPDGTPRPAPKLGEHGPEILREAGFADGEIAEILAAAAPVSD